MPGTKLGAYGRKIKANDLTGFINSFNSTIAGTATPAGQVLIQNGLFSLAQLQQIGGVIQPLDVPVAPVQSLGWLKTIDLSRLSAQDRRELYH